MDKKSNQAIESIDPRITRAKIQQTGDKSDMEDLAHFQIRIITMLLSGQMKKKYTIHLIE